MTLSPARNVETGVSIGSEVVLNGIVSNLDKLGPTFAPTVSKSNRYNGGMSRMHSKKDYLIILPIMVKFTPVIFYFKIIVCGTMLNI